jgi:hypothetical protein
MTEYDKDGKEIKIPEQIVKQSQAAYEHIRKKAILVNLERRQFANMPYDPALSYKVCEQFDIKNHELIMVIKMLINPVHLDKIRSLMNDALLMVWNHTRPWDNIGYRILPMAYHDDFKETFSKIKDEFEEAVNHFYDNWDNYVLEAKKDLGSIAFDKNNYPDKNQLKSYFKLEIKTEQIPDVTDIRLNLSGAEILKIQQDITEQYNDTITDAMKELMSVVNTDPGKAIKLVNIIEKLNINSNHEITEQLKDIKDNIGNVNVINVKDDDISESMMVIDDLDDLDDELL